LQSLSSPPLAAGALPADFLEQRTGNPMKQSPEPVTETVQIGDEFYPASELMLVNLPDNWPTLVGVFTVAALILNWF
jgi:hypothetical protein